MRTLAIEFNDAGIAIADAQSVLAIEPGCAVVEGNKIITGRDALAKARLNPRQASNRFWNAISLERGSAGSEITQSAAELAFAQIDSLWKRFGGGADNAVLVVPGHIRGEALGLGLGLANECGMDVRTIVATAVAASVRPYPGRQLLYVDAGLYRVSATLIEQGSEAIVSSEQSVITTGLASLTEGFARRIAELFVRATRFDPLHKAETEQMLYDRLPGWLERLRDQDRIEITLPQHGEEQKITLDRDALRSVTTGFNRALVQLIAYFRQPGQSVVIQVSAHLASLPGIAAELARLDDAQIVPLPPGHAARSALLKPELIQAQQGQVKLLKRLGWREPPADPSASGAEPARVTAALHEFPPTHVVYAGVVYPIGVRGIVVGREPVDGRRTIVVASQANGVSRAHCELVVRDGELKLIDLSRYGTFVNERKVAGETTLQRADVIRIGSPGAELQVVGMEPAQ